MKKGGRYKTSHLTEDQFEPGARKQVLRNLLRIKSAWEMDRIEAIALKQTEEFLFRQYDKNHQFTAKDICYIHKVWLGRIYEWAGQYRNVDLIKEDFRFPHAKYIPQLMELFEKEYLQKHTPCIFKSKDRLIKALAEVHAELVLIHPYREGNGRVARILSTLMALQAGLPPLDFRSIQGKNTKNYITAIHAAMGHHYEPMEAIFRRILEDSNR